MSRKQLEGRVSIVTGASRGIGAATARILAEAGSHVVLTARDEAWLEMVAKDVRSRGVTALVVSGDSTDSEVVEEVVESALGQFDRVDIVANCAGMVWPLDPMSEADADEWAYSIHVNLVAPFYVANNVLPLMIDQGFGRIVNVTCRSGSELRRGESALRAGKAGLEAWTQVAAKELEGSGVTIACVDPGIVDTGTRREILEMDSDDGAVDIAGWLPGEGELCSLEEAARMVYWLASSDDVRSGHIYRSTDAAWREQVNCDLGIGARSRTT